MEHLYVMKNKHTGEIITSPTSKTKYYKTLSSLIKVRDLYVRNNYKSISPNDIIIKKVKFIPIEDDLSDEDIQTINEITNKCTKEILPKYLTEKIKLNTRLKLIIEKPERKCVQCHVRSLRRKWNNPKGFAVIDDDTYEIYYIANTMDKLRRVLFDEENKENIYIS